MWPGVWLKGGSGFGRGHWIEKHCHCIALLHCVAEAVHVMSLYVNGSYEGYFPPLLSFSYTFSFIILY
jgi:hypothetical protein